MARSVGESTTAALRGLQKRRDENEDRMAARILQASKLDPEGAIDIWNKSPLAEKFGTLKMRGKKGNWNFFEADDGRIHGFDRNTGTFVANVSRSAPKPAKAPSDFTLSPGQVRHRGGTGEVVARGPEKPEGEFDPGKDVKNYLFSINEDVTPESVREAERQIGLEKEFAKETENLAFARKAEEHLEDAYRRNDVSNLLGAYDSPEYWVYEALREKDDKGNRMNKDDAWAISKEAVRLRGGDKPKADIAGYVEEAYKNHYGIETPFRSAKKLPAQKGGEKKKRKPVSKGFGTLVNEAVKF